MRMMRHARVWLWLGLLSSGSAFGCSSGDDDDTNGGSAATSGGSGGAVSPPGSGGAVAMMGGGSGGGGVAGTTGSGGGGSMNNTGGSGGSPPSGSGGVPASSDGGSSVPAGEGTTWVAMGYDQNNTYFNPGEHTLSVDNAATLVEKWRFTVAGFPPGSPVIAEGKVFGMSTGGLYAINLADGMMAWSKTDIDGTAAVFYSEGSIFVHSATANLYKIKAADGTVEWGPVLTYSLANCDGTSSPIVGGGKVVVGHSCGALEIGDTTGARGGVEAFDAATGAPAWTYWTVPMTGEDGAMVWSTVSIDVAAGVVYAGSGNNYTTQGENSDSIHAIDLATGTRIWKTQVRNNDTWSLLNVPTGPDTDFGANPILAEVGGKKIVADGDKGSAFWAFDRTTGAMLWSRTDLSTARNQANGGILNNGAFDGKLFYAVSNQPPGQAVLHAMDPMKDGMDAWPPKMFEKLTWGALSVANGLLFVPSDDELLIFNAATGDMLKSFNTGGTIASGAAAVADGKIVVKSGLEYILDSSVKSNNVVICYGLP
jgi:polyvinyl alcohol dehydrogenase (cytochrome)